MGETVIPQLLSKYFQFMTLFPGQSISKEQLIKHFPYLSQNELTNALTNLVERNLLFESEESDNFMYRLKTRIYHQTQE